MLSVPRPTPKATPGRYFGVDAVDRNVVAPAATAAGQLGVFDRVGPDRVLVAEADRRAVGSCRVELHVVDVHLDLGVSRRTTSSSRSSDVKVIGAAVTDVHANRQRLFLQLPGEQRRLVLRQREQHPLRVALDEVSRRRTCRRRRR